MPLDKTKYYVLIDNILNIFSNTFGEDLVFVEKQIAIEHMGFFEIKYRYLPLAYDIVFESERGIFDIEINDDEGANTSLYRIVKFNHETKVEDIKKAAQKLKGILKENDFSLYITRDEKIFRKKDSQYERIENLDELMRIIDNERKDR